MSDVEFCIGMGTEVGKEVEAGVEGRGLGVGDAASEGLVTVGSRKEKKL